LMQVIIQSRPKLNYYSDQGVFQKPFSRIHSNTGHQSLDFEYLLSPKSKRISLTMWDHDPRHTKGKKFLRLQMLISPEKLLRKIDEIRCVLTGGVPQLPIDREKVDAILEFYFKRRSVKRKKPEIVGLPQSDLSNEAKYAHRIIMLHCLTKGEIFAAEVSREYGFSMTRSVSILNEMVKANVLRKKRRVGRVVMYELTVERDDLTRFFTMIENLSYFTAKSAEKQERTAQEFRKSIGAPASFFQGMKFAVSSST